MTNAVVKDDYRGIMVWYSAVKNGLQYSENWDLSRDKNAQEAYNRTMNKFKSVNIYG